jgi:hypothetical protein
MACPCVDCVSIPGNDWRSKGCQVGVLADQNDAVTSRLSVTTTINDRTIHTMISIYVRLQFYGGVTT